MNLSAFIRILTAVSLILLVSSCGGGDDSKPLQQSGNNTIVQPDNQTNSEVPDSYSNSPVVVDFSYQPRFRHARLLETQIVDELMINGTGDLTHPQGEFTERGNITVSVGNIEDPDGIGRVLLGFGENAEQAIVLCDESCVSPFSFTQTGVNPFNFGQQAGSISLQVWVEDLNGNLSVVAIKQVNWQPRTIVVEPVQREEDGTVQLNWQALDSALRYNAYVSETPIENLNQIRTLPEGNRFVALSNTSQSFTGLDPKKHYYALITGIDGSGESAFSESILLPATEFTPPIANNDTFSGLQFESISGNVLSNDLDLGFGPLQVSSELVSPPQNGAVSISSNGAFNYVPTNSFFGTDSFVYQVENAQGATAQATVTINIEAVQVFILTLNNTYKVEKNTELSVSSNGVLVNDIHLGNQELQVETQPERDVSNGTLVLNSDGTFVYTPNAEFVGEDSFTYNVRSNDGEVQTAEVTIIVEEEVTNQPPVAVNDLFETSEDFILSVAAPGVLENDSDEALSGVSLGIESATSSGTLELTEEGGFRYIPNANFAGQDVFIYSITDEAGLSASAHGVITVVAVNDPPIANDDSVEVAQGQAVSISATNNDEDIDGQLDLTTLEIIMPPMHGSVSVNSGTGQFVYQSNADFRGEDYFIYVVSDNEGARSNEALVRIFVTGDNVAPVAVNDSASTSQGFQVDINVLANDSDPDGTLVFDSIEITTAPSHGQVSKNSSDNVLIYVPQSDFSGTDSFQYRVQDNEGALSNIASVTVTVQAVNQSPIANNDSAQVEIGRSVVIEVLNNDSDPDGTIEYSSLELVSSPSKGNVTIESMGSILYVHTGTAVGTDSFSYQVSDNDGLQSNIAIVTITIVEPDTTPVAVADVATLDKNTSVMIDVLSNDDAKGQTLNLSSIEIISAVQHGSTFIDTSTGSISYIPMTNFVGTDSFTYQVQNTLGETSNTATVTITVAPRNYPPTVAANSANIETDVADGTLVLQVMASDPDGDDISYTLTGTNSSLFSIAQNGNVTVANASQISSNGEAVYNLTVEVCDNISPPLCASASITINVSVAVQTYVANKLTSFGTDGQQVVRLRASMEYHEYGQTIVLSDGKLLTVGGVGQFEASISRNIHRAAVSKLNSDGFFDRTFATNGVFTSHFGIEVAGQPQNIVASAVAIDSENRIYVAGYADFGATQELLLFRLTADGAHDTSYGAGSGYTQLPLTSNARVEPVAIFVDDAQVVTVVSNVTVSTQTTIMVRRIGSTGEISGSLDIAPNSSQFANGAVGLGGTILVYGETTSEAGNKDVLITRFNDSTLSLDSAFGSSGMLQLDIASLSFDDRVNDVAQLSDNKLLVTGDTYLPGGTIKSTFVMRLANDGTLDNTFDTDGFKVYDLNELPSSSISGLDLSSWHASGKGLFADENHYYIGVGRGQSTSSYSVAQIFRTSHVGVADSDWVPDLGGPTAFNSLGLNPGGMLRTAQGLLIPGDKYNLIGNNFFRSYWFGEFTLAGVPNSTFGSNGVANVTVGDADERFEFGLLSVLQSDKFFLVGDAKTSQNNDVPYIYKLDSTGKGSADFGNLGISQLSTGINAIATASAQVISGNVLMAFSGVTSNTDAYIASFATGSIQDMSFAGGVNQGIVQISASTYSGESITIKRLYGLATGDFLAFAKIYDGCINQSYGFVFSSLGVLTGNFQYPVPGTPACNTSARSIDFVHPVSTFLVGIGTDEQVFPEPRVILAKATVTGALDPTFGNMGVAELDIGLTSGETIDLQGSLVDSEGRFVIFGTAGSKNFVLRVNANGSIDSNFGSAGVLTFEQLGSTAVSIKQGWVQSTGELVLFLQETGGLNVYIARVKLADDAGTFDATFNSVGYQNFATAMTGQLSSAISLNNGDNFVLVLQQDEPKVIVLQAGKIEIAD
ncbi:Ig-like domain-containing protein [Pseudoalteromonas luteoviolacea]|uniref:Ig-like domain-containing protein n=1 Tax=Pseudoalteromonas luteoviolacea TaxID=43657 RepID=UPI001B38323F|nr:Ig-like domain-containing protein [Pseudoalteromonas luteoviolacea]MBQ4835874.1 tandem-95 repeat protein [Pseudoalteromonas luteoviolacea]